MAVCFLKVRLVILLFVAPVARHTIAGRGERIVFGSILVLPGIIMVLVTAGAPPNRRARFMAMVQSSYPRARSWYWSRPVLLLFVVPSMKDGVPVRVAMVRS